MTGTTPGPGAKARGRRPAFAPDPNTDRLVSMLLALAGEVWVLRERLDTVERLLARSGGIAPGQVDAYTPDPAAAEAREAARAAYLDRVMWIVTAAQTEAAAGETPDSYQAVVDALAGRTAD
ncbi:MAG: hypothetical protein RIB84_10685 [Sneathiellaceae bacterium]